MCNYKLTVTISKNSEIVDGGGWVTSMTWRKSTLLEAKDRAQVLALRDLLNGDKPAVDEDGMLRPAETKTGIKVVSTNMLTADEATPFLWRGPVLNGILTQFYSDINWGELDYLIVDMPPGTGDIPMTVFQQFPLKGVVIATAPQVLVNMIVEKAIRMTEHMNVPVLGLVENMSYYECPDCGARHEIFGKSEVEAIAKSKGIDAWACVPMDPKISAEVDSGNVEDIKGDWLDPIVDKIESL